jgi:y4mF family transcriptional regulator
MKTIGETIKENRKRMHLTQLDLAMYAGVSPKFIIEVENNKETIQLNKLVDVLNVFDLGLQVVSKKEIG